MENKVTADIIDSDASILVTGANGFIGSRLVKQLLSSGFNRIRCFVRPTSNIAQLDKILREFESSRYEIVKGNLLSRADCEAAARDISVAYHLAAGIEKTFPGCFLNSAVTTRNLLDALMDKGSLKRFVNVSSLAVYSNSNIPRGGLLDEFCQLEADMYGRHDAYGYGKLKQDEIVLRYAQNKCLPFVIVRPGLVFGPGKARIPGRVGLDSFGIFLHLGNGNRIPLTYVDNCAEAIALAGIRAGIDGETINIIDDDLPTSRRFLHLYKRNVRKFFSISLPYRGLVMLCYFWEKYSKWSEGQLPPVFNCKFGDAYWRGNTYSNAKAKNLLNWSPKTDMNTGLAKFFAYARGARG